MQIIAHRGFWLEPSQKNTLEAFERALSHGFGIETDFRDCAGKLVIAHDLPGGGEMPAQDFFALCKQFPESQIHALNIKADGLQKLFLNLLSEWDAKDYFLFDMSIPDTLAYFKMSLPVYIRRSEFELSSILEAQASGVWLDAFTSEWYGIDVIDDLLHAGKGVALVSPELHGRPHEKYWEFLKSAKIANHPKLSLCTDYPLQAKEYFHE